MESFVKLFGSLLWYTAVSTASSFSGTSIANLFVAGRNISASHVA
jgi:hypothetical protein